MQRVAAFDIARGMAVALVVLLHATLMPYAAVDLPQPVCRMALLLLISGALAAPAPGRDGAYYRARALDLAWLLLLWTPVLLMARNGFAGLAALPLELVSPTSHLWYIGGLALLLATAPLAARLPAAVALSIAAAGAAWHTLGGRTGVPGWDQLAHFAVFFYIGFYSRDRLAMALSRCGARTGLAAASGLASLFILPVPHFVVTLGSAAAILLIAQALAPTRIGTGLAWFGRRTPDTYLAHEPLLWMLTGLIGHIAPIGLVLLVPVVIAACLGLRMVADRLGCGWLYQRPRLSLGVWPRPSKALA